MLLRVPHWRAPHRSAGDLHELSTPPTQSAGPPTPAQLNDSATGTSVDIVGSSLHLTLPTRLRSNVIRLFYVLIPG